jgi:hypothetical protein
MPVQIRATRAKLPRTAAAIVPGGVMFRADIGTGCEMLVELTGIEAEDEG